MEIESEPHQDILGLVGYFGTFHKKYVIRVMGLVWFFCGASTVVMLFVAQEPPRYPLCDDIINIHHQPCIPTIPLSENDCSTPYHYIHPTASIISEFKAIPLTCSSYHSESLLAGAAWTQSAFFVGFLIGVFSLGRLGDAAGRWWGLTVALFVLEISSLFTGFAGSLIQFGLLRGCVGFGVGGAGLLTFITLAEVTGDQYRHWLALLHAIAFALGGSTVCLLSIIIPSWRFLLLILSFFGLSILCIPFNKLAIESPRWLASKGYGERALSVWKLIAETNNYVLPTTITAEGLVYEAKYGQSNSFQDSDSTDSYHYPHHNSKKLFLAHYPLSKKKKPTIPFSSLSNTIESTNTPKEAYNKYDDDDDDDNIKEQFDKDLNTNEYNHVTTNANEHNMYPIHNNQKLFSIIMMEPLKKWFFALILLWFSASLIYYGVYFNEEFLKEQALSSTHDPTIEPIESFKNVYLVNDAKKRMMKEENHLLNSKNDDIFNTSKPFQKLLSSKEEPKKLYLNSYDIIAENYFNQSKLLYSRTPALQDLNKKKEDFIIIDTNNRHLQPQDEYIGEQQNQNVFLNNSKTFKKYVKPTPTTTMLNYHNIDEPTTTSSFNINDNLDTTSYLKNQNAIKKNKVYNMNNAKYNVNQNDLETGSIDTSMSPNEYGNDLFTRSPKKKPAPILPQRSKINKPKRTTISTLPTSNIITYEPSIPKRPQHVKDQINVIDEDKPISFNNNDYDNQQAADIPFTDTMQLNHLDSNNTNNNSSTFLDNLIPLVQKKIQDLTYELKGNDNTTTTQKNTTETLHESVVALGQELGKAVTQELGKGFKQIHEQLQEFDVHGVWEGKPLHEQISNTSNNNFDSNPWDYRKKLIFYNFYENDLDAKFWKDMRRLGWMTFLAFFLEVPTGLIAVSLAGRRFCGRKGVITTFLSISGTLSLTSFILLKVIPEHTIAWIPLIVNIARLFVSGGFLLLYVYTSELLPTPIRSSTIGICSMSARVAGIIAPFIVRRFQVWHPASQLILFGVLSIAAAITTGIVLPETYGKKMMDSILTFQKNYGYIKKQKNQDQERIALTVVTPENEDI